MIKPPIQIVSFLLLAFSWLSSHAASAQGKAEESYPIHPDSQRQEGVPRGEVTQGTFTESAIYPGTTRDYWVYVPALYDGSEPACLMVFQDGGRAWPEDGSIRASVVFDNLIHQGDMPVTIGVFVNPGVVPARDPKKAPDRRNRAFEYDTVSSRYAEFLLEELLPVALDGLNVSDAPGDRGIAGGSSGAIAAFNVAWQRPDAFSRVFSWVGTYVGIRGGHEFPTLVRKTEPKPLRVFLQDGSNDLDIAMGSWWIANQDMLAAFNFSGYEVNHLWGEGYHGGKHAGAIMPDALRWLWETWPEAPKTHLTEAQNPGVQNFLIGGEDWELIADGFEFTEGPALSPDGAIFFSDLEASEIYRMEPVEGALPELWMADSGGTNGLAFDRLGRLYGCQRDASQVVRWDVETKEMEVLVSDVKPNDIIVANDGTVYFTEPRKKAVWCIPADARKPFIAADGYSGVNGVTLSPDQTQVYAADYGGRFVWVAQRAADDSLLHNQPHIHLHLPPASLDTRSQADGLAVNADGSVLIATAMGIQIAEPRNAAVQFIMPPPAGARHAANIYFAADGSTLIATCGDKVFRRATRFSGVTAYKTPFLPKTRP